MKTPESFEKDDIKKFLKSVGAYFIVVHMTGYGQGGTSDIVGCLNGQFFSVEVKREGKEPTPRQVTRMQAVETAGGKPFWGTAEKVIREMTDWILASDVRSALPLHAAVARAHTIQSTPR